MVRSRARHAAVLVLTIVFLLGLATAAHAVTLSGPSDALATATLRVTPSAEESPGVGYLLRDGALVATCSVDAGAGAVVLEDMPLGGSGLHRFRLLVRSSRGTVMSNVLAVRSWGRPGVPVLVDPKPGGVAPKTCTITARTGYSTSSVSLYVNGVFVRTVKAASSSTVSLGQITIGKGRTTITLVARNPLLKNAATYSITRLEYPWPTCIIIDKSDFRLYWIKDGMLVKSYPIATGRASMETPTGVWRVGAKYVTDAGGVYGPRKMRLFRKVGDSFVYTRYLIHGTNEPWVIGTKASHGCIRLYNKDVLDLYPRIPLGTMVQIRS